MKAYRHPSDPPDFKFGRTVGKKNRGPSWQATATAKLAPHELDGASETTVQALILDEITARGAVYITFEDSIYSWLRMEAARAWQAKSILATIKDFPDILVLRKVEGEPYPRALSLELKRKRKSDGGKPGQKRLAQAIGGTIAIGYEEAHAALESFFK